MILVIDERGSSLDEEHAKKVVENEKKIQEKRQARTGHAPQLR